MFEYSPLNLFWIITSRTSNAMNNFIGLVFFFPLFFQALSTESVEKLPVFNKSAFKHYQMSTEADDWCIPSKEPKNLAKEKVALWRGTPRTLQGINVGLYPGCFLNVWVWTHFLRNKQQPQKLLGQDTGAKRSRAHVCDWGEHSQCRTMEWTDHQMVIFNLE